MRNKNVDIIRALALLLVIIYHIWVFMGSPTLNVYALQVIVSLGGEIGVTIFFILSGFGIFCSLDKDQNNVSGFFKRRAIRILPEYYLVLLMMLLFVGGCTYYISGKGLINILLHMVFMHNFSPLYAGTINGVLWTMAVIVQFYIVAIPLYKAIKKWGIIVPVITMGLTIACKYCLFNFTEEGFRVTNAFWLSRQLLPSVIDNFVLGMYSAYFISSRYKTYKNSEKFVKFAAIIIGCSSLVLSYIVCSTGLKYGIHTKNVSGYFWHSLLALFLSFTITSAGMFYIKSYHFPGVFLLWLSKKEYVTYLIHLVLIQNLLGNSPLFGKMLSRSMYLFTGILLVIITVGTGTICTMLIDGVRSSLKQIIMISKK